MLLVLLVKIKKIVSALSGIMLNAKLVQQRSILMTQDERFDRLENMLRSIILNQQVLWDALMEIPDVPNDTKPILKRIK
jgi:hypothetical protein